MIPACFSNSPGMVKPRAAGDSLGGASRVAALALILLEEPRDRCLATNTHKIGSAFSQTASVILAN